MGKKRKSLLEELLYSQENVMVAAPTTFKVYALVEEEKGRVFYIGCTGSTLKQRFQMHVADMRRGKQAPVYKEMRRVFCRGNKVKIELHATFNTLGEALAVEETLIKTYVADQLTNVIHNDKVALERFVERVNRKRNNKVTVDDLKTCAKNGKGVPLDR